ncbi:MAG: type II secretion system protein [Planctomycetota bacterium]|nr:MAG: type II secretion system protein [Planctomycetota bacterium]
MSHDGDDNLRPNPPENAHKRRSWRMPAIVLGTIGLLLAIVLYPKLMSARQERVAATLKSQVHLRIISEAMEVYADRHNDLFPPALQTIETLQSEGLLETGMEVSPIEDGDGISYIFTGVRARSFSTTQIVAYEDPKHTDEWVYVLFGDLKVRRMSHADLDVALTNQTNQTTPP